MKDKVIQSGYLLPNLDYTNVLLNVNELFDLVSTKFSFLISNQDLKNSTLSVYNLPCSDQFDEISMDWSLDQLDLPINIEKKEKLITSEIKKEKSIYYSY